MDSHTLLELTFVIAVYAGIAATLLTGFLASRRTGNPAWCLVPVALLAGEVILSAAFYGPAWALAGQGPVSAIMPLRMVDFKGWVLLAPLLTGLALYRLLRRDPALTTASAS